MNAKEFLKRVDQQGCVEASPGVWVWSRAMVLDDQKTWASSDKCKEFDFTLYPYWISDSCGMVPIGIMDADDEDLHFSLT